MSSKFSRLAIRLELFQLVQVVYSLSHAHILVCFDSSSPLPRSPIQSPTTPPTRFDCECLEWLGNSGTKACISTVNVELLQVETKHSRFSTTRAGLQRLHESNSVAGAQPTRAQQHPDNDKAIFAVVHIFLGHKSPPGQI